MKKTTLFVSLLCMIALLVACNPGPDSGNPEHPDVNTTADDMSFLGSTEEAQLASVEDAGYAIINGMINRTMYFGGSEEDYLTPGSYVSEPDGVWKIDISEVADNRQPIKAVITEARVQSQSDVNVFYNVWGNAEITLASKYYEDFIFEGVVRDENGNVFKFTVNNPLADGEIHYTVNGKEFVGQY